VIEIFLNLWTHPLRARRFDKRHQRGIRPDDGLMKGETHARNGEVPVRQTIVGDQRARAPADALERVGRAWKRRRLVLLRHQRRHADTEKCGNCDSRFHIVLYFLLFTFYFLLSR
jgi:hypothetical protein